MKKAIEMILHPRSASLYHSYLLRSFMNGLGSSLGTQKAFSSSARNNSQPPFYSRLKDKVAVLAASTDGIGLASAKRLAEEGAKVVVSSRKKENVDEAVKKLESCGLTVLGVPCHVSNENDRNELIEKTLERFGGIDILVSNAAVNPATTGVIGCSGEVWDKIFEVNVKNSLQLTQLVLPHMRKRKGGSIVYISTVGAFQSNNMYDRDAEGLNAFNMMGAYSISKTALLALTKIMAQEAAPDNIRVNSVCPGLIKTKFSHHLYTDSAIQKSMDLNLLRRMGTPEEIASTVAFLSSDDASYITAENIAVAAGMSSRL